MSLENSGYLIYLAGLAGVLHACLHLPLATLLHMAGHTLGRNQPGRVLGLGLSFSLGVFLTVAGLLFVAMLVALSIPEASVRFGLAGVLTLVAGAVIMLGYFRNMSAADGAQLWFSRRYISWFHKYVERQHGLFSAFWLGNLAILLEGAFSVPLLLAAGTLLATAGSGTVLSGFGLYALIVSLPLVLVSISLTGGSNALRLQRWRAGGKRFWQFFVGVAFILFGLYVASERFLYTAGAAV